MMKLLKTMWCLPLTLLGLLAVAASFGRRTTVWSFNLLGSKGFVVEAGPIFWLMDRMGMAGITMGQVIIYDNLPSIRTTLHELEHVKQMERWGLLFPVIYYAEFLWHLSFIMAEATEDVEWSVLWREAYREIHFEREARLASGERVVVRVMP